MSKLHGEEREDRIGRGELRNPGDRADQPGQGKDSVSSDEDNQRDTRSDNASEPVAGTGDR